MFLSQIPYSYEDSSRNSHAHLALISRSLPLELRIPDLSQTPLLLELLTDKRNIEHDLSASTLNTQEAITQFIQDAYSFSNPPNPAIPDKVNLVVLADGKICGLSGLGRITTDSTGRRTGDLGVMIDSEFRGRGYAEESLRICLDYALRVLKIDEVVVSCTAANEAMRGLMEKKFGLQAMRQDAEDSEFGNECLYIFRKEDMG